MEIKQYLNARKKLYDHLLGFIDNQEDSQSDYLNLISDITNQKITENKNEFENFLHLIVLISSYHHRNLNFYSKIDQILSYLSKKITQTFSNSEIFNIFSQNKRVLFFLIKNEIFKVEQELMKLIKSRYFHQYLAEFNKSDAKHVQKKEIGENDSYICEIIRKDSLDEFIIYINENNCSLANTIKPSIYETNSFLINKKVDFLDYAIFFGSIKIVKYMLANGLKLTDHLWPFAIHSNNPEIISLFEENNVIPQQNKISLYLLKLSIMCHHNDIANYIQENYIQNNNVFHKNSQAYSFLFFNYAKNAESEIDNNLFLHACKCNYFELVKLLLNDVNIDINYNIITKKKSLFY